MMQVAFGRVLRKSLITRIAQIAQILRCTLSETNSGYGRFSRELHGSDFRKM